MATHTTPTASSPTSAWHLRDAQELAHEHGVDPATGLSEQQVSLRLLQHGANELPTTSSRSL